MDIDKIANKFNEKSVLVVGDIMLDKYLYSNVSRISPEAPIPVAHIQKEKYSLGGAGNTANNISSLGGKAYLCGVIGTGLSNEILMEELRKANINTDNIILDKDRCTIEKIRVLGGSQQLLRIDYEELCPLSREVEDLLIIKIENTIRHVDAISISDYKKGVVTERVMQAIINQSKIFNKPIIADPKPSNINLFRDVYVVMPNAKEASEIAGTIDIENFRGTDIDDPSIEGVGKKIMQQLNSNVLITRGSRGMSLFEKNGAITHIPTEAKEIYDVSGAGDTVNASFTLAIASGASLLEAADIANKAAGIVVGKVGTATVSKEELINLLRRDIRNILFESIEVKKAVITNQLDKIEKATKIIMNAYKNKKKILVFGNGGSASDAQHLAGELVGRFKMERKGFPAIALTTDSSIITSIANDFGYDKVFERQIETLANEGDVVIGISTSGNSSNVLNAMKKARELKTITIGFTGKNGYQLEELTDVCILVPSDNTPRIQEAHVSIIHILCELLEKEMESEITPAPTDRQWTPGYL